MGSKDWILISHVPYVQSEPAHNWRCKSKLQPCTSPSLGGLLQSGALKAKEDKQRHKRYQHYWSGVLGQSCLSTSEKVSERTSEREGFQRLSEVLRGFQRFFRGPLGAPLRVPFSSQTCGPSCPEPCCPLKLLQIKSAPPKLRTTTNGDHGKICSWWVLTACDARSLRGPAAILFISRDACSDSITEMFSARFCGGYRTVNYRAICRKVGCRRDAPV